MTKLLPAILRRRRSVLGRRRVGFLLQILCRLLLCRLQIVHDLLQTGERAFEAFDLPVGGIELLLVVEAELADRLLQEVDIALQAAGPPLHGLFDGADFDAGNVLRIGARGETRRQQRQDEKNSPADHQILIQRSIHHGKLLEARAPHQRYHTDTAFGRCGFADYWQSTFSRGTQTNVCRPR